jgi:signal transduction histidine kinase
VPGSIEQVLDNLLDNALNASPDGATIRLELLPGATEHLLAVTDEGPGLDDADKERALRRFWRGDPSTPGTGLGLAIAQALVLGSGGTIELADAVGNGLRVVVRLPAA